MSETTLAVVEWSVEMAKPTIFTLGKWCKTGADLFKVLDENAPPEIKEKGLTRVHASEDRIYPPEHFHKYGCDIESHDEDGFDFLMSVVKGNEKADQTCIKMVPLPKLR